MRKKDLETIVTQIKDQELVQKRHLRLAKKASKLFVKKGYYQTSIREISKAANFTIGNLYDYISKKEDVLYLVIDFFHTIWVSKLEKERINEIKDPVERLKVAIRCMLKLVNENKEIILLAYRESKSLPRQYLKMVLEKESCIVESFERILQDGIEKGVFKIKNPFFIANIIVYLFGLEPLRGWSLFKRYNVRRVNDLIENLILKFVLS